MAAEPDLCPPTSDGVGGGCGGERGEMWWVSRHRERRTWSVWNRLRRGRVVAVVDFVVVAAAAVVVAEAVVDLKAWEESLIGWHTRRKR